MKHQQKLSSIKSGHERIVKYHKYLKKDSAREMKWRDKRARKEWDSIRKADANSRRVRDELAKRGISGDKQIAFADSLQDVLKACQQVLKDSASTDSARQAATARIRAISKDKVNAELARHGHPYRAEFLLVDSLKKELKKSWTIWKDSCASDSSRRVAKSNVKNLTVACAMRNKEFRGIYEQYVQTGETLPWNILNRYVPGIDTLQGAFDSTPLELMTRAEDVAVQELLKRTDAGELGGKLGEIDQMKSRVNSFSDPEKLKQEAIGKVKDNALDHFSGQEQKLQAAQAKMSKLTSKYSSFTDSNDLSSAVKRTSLQGKTLKERLVIGGNFNVVSTDPVSLDLSPLVGFKFNTRFYIGVGANYRHTFGDSLKFAWYVSPSNSSLRCFANYDLIKNFFAYTEVEIAGLKLKAGETIQNTWTTNYFVGLGKKILIHPKIYLTATALYNLNDQDNNPSYPRRFQVRLGFQNSDLAFRKKKVYYQR